MNQPLLAALLLAVGFAGCTDVPESEPDAVLPSITGVILRDHGEFEHYNASTFQTLKALVDAYWPYTNAPAELLQVDAGTWYIDAAQPWNDEPHLPEQLHDAWARPGPAAAVPVKDIVNITQIPHELELDHLVYFAPAGEGNGEGDLYELFGLAVYRKYLLMDNHSPHWSHTKPYWDFIDAELTARGIPVAFAHSEDPFINRSHTFEGAARAMVEAGVETVISISQGALRSDFDACVKRPELEEALHEAGFHGEIRHADAAMALRSDWTDASAAYVAAQVATLPADWDVAIMDVHHGFPPNGGSLCEDRHDPYHEAAQEAGDAFHHALARAADRPLGIQMVYNEFAHDRGDRYISPDEAWDILAPEHDAVVAVSPYFSGDGMDLLITLRESLGFERQNAPYHAADYESRLTRDGTFLWVLSSDHAQEVRKQVLLDVVLEQLELHA